MDPLKVFGALYGQGSINPDSDSHNSVIGRSSRIIAFLVAIVSKLQYSGIRGSTHKMASNSSLPPPSGAALPREVVRGTTGTPSDLSAPLNFDSEQPGMNQRSFFCHYLLSLQELHSTFVLKQSNKFSCHRGLST